MEYAKKAVDFLNFNGSAALTVIQIAGYWVVTLNAYTSCSKTIANQDLKKTIVIMLRAAAYIIILFKARDFLVWASKL